MLLLAANPDVQDWVAEELQEIIPNRDAEKWDYSVLFADLKRCRAVLVCVPSPIERYSNSHRIARDSPSLPTNHDASEMEQRASTKTLYQRTGNRHSTPHNSVPRPISSPNPSPVRAQPSPLAALQVDHLLARPSPAGPQISKQLSHQIAPRGDHDPQAERLLPLVRRATELPRRQIRPGRIHRRAGLLAARSSRRDSPGERRELRKRQSARLGPAGGL
jgi:hypothetical protein